MGKMESIGSIPEDNSLDFTVTNEVVAKQLGAQKAEESVPRPEDVDAAQQLIRSLSLKSYNQYTSAEKDAFTEAQQIIDKARREVDPFGNERILH